MTVLKFSPEEWATMKVIKNSISYYQEKVRDNDVYGTAIAKEKRLLKSCIRDLYERAA